MIKVLPFCFADPVFFEPPERMSDDDTRYAQTRLPAPDGWSRTEEGLWVVLRLTASMLPEQGWKIHVSATLAEAERALALVWDYCLAHRLSFKFLRSRDAVLVTDGKGGHRGSSGKLVTIYPVDEAELAATLTGLGLLLTGVAGPYILSDLRYGNGPLYVRYGAFFLMHCPDEHGEPVAALRGPDGRLVPDRRGPIFDLPDWVPVPEILRSSLSSRQSGDGSKLPYQVQRALHFSNAGGVYLAADRTTGEQVVLREARPHAGLDRTGMDAVARLENERMTLTRLAGLDCVPRLLSHHLVWEHHFLVEEYVEGETLLEAIISRHPHTHPHPTRAKLTEYQNWAADVMTKIADALHAIHQRGIRFGDLQPTNVILRPDGRVVLIDFEVAAELSDTAPAPLGTPGFAAPRHLSGTDIDWYAWECLRLFIELPLSQLLDRDSRKAPTLIDAAGELFETAPLHRPRLLRYLRHTAMDQADHAATMFASAESDWPTIIDSLIAGIHASATPERTDRLFPGDPTQYVSHGVAFGTGAAGVLLALHQVGAPVPGHYVDWLITTAIRAASSLRPGLYDGLHGVAAVLDILGRPSEALEILGFARAKGDRAPTAGLFGGRAGIALNLLHFAARTGDDALRQAAVRLGDDLAALLTDDRPTNLWAPTGAGLMRGMTGPALLFLHLYDLAGDARYLDLAERALRRDLKQCVTWPDGSLQVRQATSHLPYLGDGSAGLALVLREYLRHRENAELATTLDGIRLACRVKHVFQPGLFQGRAGLLAVLASLGMPEDQPVVRDHVRRLGWHALTFHDQLAFPGRLLQRLSMDLATGSAGVLLALDTAFGQATSILPFLDTRSSTAASINE